MSNMKNLIFWGAAWGLLEATLGWGLHLIHFKGEALILYPFGLACMLAAARQCTGSMARTALKVAAIASIIKLINLFTWVGVPAYYVTNPAIAIFLEGLVTFAFCTVIEKRQGKALSSYTQIGMAFLIVLSSFFLFRGWQITMDTWVAHNPSAHLSMDGGLLWLWTWRSALQAVMLVAAVRMALSWRPSESWNIQSARWALPTFIIALLANYYL